MAKAKKKVAKSGAVEKNIAAALEKLGVAVGDGNRAVAARAKMQKPLIAQVKRLTKRKGVLTRKRKTAKGKAKSNPGVETRRALKQIEKELATTIKLLAKGRASKAVNGDELKALKTAAKQANAYQKAITHADKALKR